MNRSSTVIVNTVILCTVNIIFTFVGIFLNSVVIVSLLNSQLKRRLCYFMILVLACFDLAVVVVLHPLITVSTLSYWIPMGYEMEFVDKAWPWLEQLYAFSFIALLTMTVERYLALVHPFFHQRCVTRSRLMIVLAVFQLPFCILIFFLPDDDTKKYIEAALPVGIIGAVFLVICGINLKLFFLARAMRQRVDIPLGTLDGSEETNAESNKSKATLATSRKISTCLLAVVCLFICYCPFFVLTGLELTKKGDETESEHIELWEYTFFTLNSSLNSLIFFYKNSALRRHAMKLLQKCVSSAKARTACLPLYILSRDVQARMG